ncbi:hypothetical protein K439DRAFT_1617884 [Ramaria rubella]|nr:hypothetical protein K439DRAFT_1617884 [Ramaria rubella]
MAIARVGRDSGAGLGVSSAKPSLQEFMELKFQKALGTNLQCNDVTKCFQPFCDSDVTVLLSMFVISLRGLYPIEIITKFRYTLQLEQGDAVCIIYLLTVVWFNPFPAEIYKALDVETGQMCAVKVTLDHTDHVQETRAYLKLRGQKGILNLLWYGQIKSGWVLVLEYLRADLGMMQEVCPNIGQTTSLALMALEMNFTLGSVDDKDPTIFLMDFGSSFPYLINGKHIADGQVNTSVAATPAFAPIRYHTEHQLSHQDDIESIAYVLFDI